MPIENGSWDNCCCLGIFVFLYFFSRTERGWQGKLICSIKLILSSGRGDNKVPEWISFKVKILNRKAYSKLHVRIVKEAELVSFLWSRKESIRKAPKQWNESSRKESSNVFFKLDVQFKFGMTISKIEVCKSKHTESLLSHTYNYLCNKIAVGTSLHFCEVYLKFSSAVNLKKEDKMRRNCILLDWFVESEIKYPSIEEKVTVILEVVEVAWEGWNSKGGRWPESIF